MYVLLPDAQHEHVSTGDRRGELLSERQSATDSGSCVRSFPAERMVEWTRQRPALCSLSFWGARSHFQIPARDLPARRGRSGWFFFFLARRRPVRFQVRAVILQWCRTDGCLYVGRASGWQAPHLRVQRGAWRTCKLGSVTETGRARRNAWGWMVPSGGARRLLALKSSTRHGSATGEAERPGRN